MENLDLFNIVLFVVTGFVAAFIDSTVGGGRADFSACTFNIRSARKYGAWNQ